MTIVRRGSGYGVKVWDPHRKTYTWVGTFPTEADAIIAERDARLRPGRDMPTVEQWVRIWLSDYARPAPATQRTYRYALARVVEELGSRKLFDIDRPQARKLANRWPRDTTRTVRAMWADAVRDGVTAVNPWTNLRLETPRGRKDLDALTEEEIHELANLAVACHDEYGPEARAIILTLAYTGIRPGELCTIRRRDLDPRARELVVRFNLDGTGREKLPKNGKPRIVTVPPPALTAISAFQPIAADDYLFHTARGHRLSKGSLSYMWRPILAAWRSSGGRSVVLYELRHAAATLFLERGSTPADVAVQLGHTDGGRLVQVLYGHPSEDRARDRLKMAFADELSSVAERSRRSA